MPNHVLPSGRYTGWVKQQPDRRDLKFQPSHEVMQALPPSADLTAGMGPVLDQLSLGSCGPNSIDSLIMFDQQKQGLIQRSVSRLFVYYQTRVLMNTVGQDSGVDNRTMLKALAQFGYCDENLDPYNISAFTQAPPPAAVVAAAQNKVVNYSAVPQTLDGMKGCVASGFPFLFGFSVYESFEGQQASKTGIIPLPGPSESLLGGHDVTPCGFSDVQKPGMKAGNVWPANTFRFKNSWNPGWGDMGFGYFPYAYMTDPNLSGDFWVINAIPGGTPTPPTPPVVTGNVLTLTTAIPPGTYPLSGYGTLVVGSLMAPGQYVITPAGVVPIPPSPQPTGEAIVLSVDVRAGQSVRFLHAKSAGTYVKMAAETIVSDTPDDGSGGEPTGGGVVVTPH